MIDATDNASVGGDSVSLAKDDVMTARDGLVASFQLVMLVADEDVPLARAFGGGIVTIAIIRRALGRP